MSFAITEMIVADVYHVFESSCVWFEREFNCVSCPIYLVVINISAFRLQLSPVATTCVHPRGWTDYCTSHKPKPRHWAHEGFIAPRLLCGTRSRWTWVIPDSRSTPLEQNWNLTFSQLIDWFFPLSTHVLYYCSLFAVCANVMFISWHVQMSEMNWIELNWELERKIEYRRQIQRTILRQPSPSTYTRAIGHYIGHVQWYSVVQYWSPLMILNPAARVRILSGG